MLHRILPLLCVVPLANSVSAPAAEPDNVQRVRTYWRKVWTEGNLAAVAEFYDPACKHGKNFSIEKFQRSVSRQRESFPDMSVEVHEVFAHDNWVVTRVTYRATHTGREMFGQQPIGGKCEAPGLDVFVFRDGKCIEHLHVADHLDLVLGMGLKLTPTPPGQKGAGG